MIKKTLSWLFVSLFGPFETKEETEVNELYSLRRKQLHDAKINLITSQAKAEHHQGIAEVSRKIIDRLTAEGVV